ncbi:ISL3 family transposase [Dictyobacter alpinus]|nr:ISL3 family transposase [Dictyobacter alpinus]
MPTTPLFPLPDGLEIISIHEEENNLKVHIISKRIGCLCPGCAQSSQAIHSYYRRHPMELPCTGRVVKISLSVKKFFCRNPSCQRKVFTERIPELIEPSSRLTTRLRTLVQAIGIAFNANGGARLGAQMGVHVSRMTVLFSLHLLPLPSVGKIIRVGIDDFAWKRGVRYGTVLIDLDSHEIIDMLPDREAESVKTWLASHPEVEIVSRDRGGAYSDGAAQGAPQAIQCADRWHLCKNLGDAVESYLKRQSLSIPAPSAPVPTSEKKEKPTYEQRRQERRSQATFERKQEIVERVREMHTQGRSGHDIAAELGLARGTVRKYLHIEGPVRIAPRTRKPSLIDPYYEYLCQRWNEETPTAQQLFEELQEKGYQGGISILKEVVTRLRRGLSGMKYPPQSIYTKKMPAMLSARELRWLLAKREDNLTAEEKHGLTKLFESSQEVGQLYCFLQSFLRMVRELKPDLLNGWMKEVRESKIQELVSFVNGIDRDYDAVRAGLTYSWSQGPVEGTINKIKTHKRLMYGRASFSLLRTKMLHQKVS